mmetsp:Transcript_8629/g.10897  ORF Transcript_8629/g.10897 Transcript_8629/m.10897 type:complete len:355 (+) Transcript_8629:97-1161(+)
MTTYIYHERQEALLCGQHALNNLLQTETFTPDSLARIGRQLDQMELHYMASGNEEGVESKDYLRRMAEGSGNVDESGNFSIEVLRSALLSHFDLNLANTLQESVRNMEITNFDGFICNRSSHWFAIRKINDQYWNLNSTKERPELISHFRLAAEIEFLQSSGYSVFCVIEIGMLPPPCTSEAELHARGSKQFWWKESDLLNGSGTRGISNHWSKENVGNGMRLDGGQVAETAIPIANPVADFSNMSEEEMLQMALAASIQNDESSHVELSEEPLPNAEGAVRLQFRLPDGSKKERRFLKTESTKVLSSFVSSNCPNHTSKKLELRAGFPPKIVSFDASIETANLAGEQIQCRYI